MTWCVLLFELQN